MPGSQLTASNQHAGQSTNPPRGLSTPREDRWNGRGGFSPCRIWVSGHTEPFPPDSARAWLETGHYVYDEYLNPVELLSLNPGFTRLVPSQNPDIPPWTGGYDVLTFSNEVQRQIREVDRIVHSHHGGPPATNRQRLRRDAERWRHTDWHGIVRTEQGLPQPPEDGTFFRRHPCKS